MAQFIDVHHGLHGVTQEQLEAAHALDLENEGAEGVHFERAWLDADSGQAFCLSTAPSKEAIMRVHEKTGIPVTEVHELTAQV
jgi:Protein of unknown function (DUF4242)